MPAFIGSFIGGRLLYDKLTAHYLNWEDRDIPHTWLIDFADKYKVKDHDKVDSWEHDIPLTPFDRFKRELTSNNKAVNVEEEKVYRRLGKDKNDFYFLYGKVRNLENIVYLSEEDLKEINNPYELQLKLDAVIPGILKTDSADGHVEQLHNTINEIKDYVENSKNFRSVKNKLLGLPFMMMRHKQYPEPAPGTWQFALYEHIFKEPYDQGLQMPEIEEKINKYNYHKFLHPSIIKKYDTNSEEFDMFLKQKNIESHTSKENASIRREYFCKTLMPYLNLINNKEQGYDFAHYVINKSRTNDYENFLYDKYSGQKEEKLFREAEEYNYMNKNQPFVERTQYTSVNKEQIGIKASELEDLFNNPTKKKIMERTLKKIYPYYDEPSVLDEMNKYRMRAGLVETMIEFNIDPNDPKWFDNAWEAQYTSRDEVSEEETAMISHDKNYPIFGEISNYPYNEIPTNKYFYDYRLDWNDYRTQFPTTGFVSPKNRRFELHNAVNNSFCKFIY